MRTMCGTCSKCLFKGCLETRHPFNRKFNFNRFFRKIGNRNFNRFFWFSKEIGILIGSFGFQNVYQRIVKASTESLAFLQNIWV